MHVKPVWACPCGYLPYFIVVDFSFLCYVKTEKGLNEPKTQIVFIFHGKNGNAGSGSEEPRKTFYLLLHGQVLSPIPVHLKREK